MTFRKTHHDAAKPTTASLGNKVGQQSYFASQVGPIVPCSEAPPPTRAAHETTTRRQAARALDDALRAAKKLPAQIGLFTDCQRWRHHRSSYRPAGEPICTSRYSVEPIDFATGKRFVIEHHYSGSMPPTRFVVGLWHKPSRFLQDELVGVAAFTVSVQERAIPAWLGGIHPRLGVELGRFVLSDSVEANGESWSLSRAWRLLREHLPEVVGVLSYSDPLELTALDGSVVKRGHTGCIYRAFNGAYLGRASARTLLLASDGRVVSERALSKLRNGEVGAGYATRQLVEAGAPKRMLSESADAWIDRTLRSGAFRRVRHPGNLVFAWALP